MTAMKNLNVSLKISTFFAAFLFVTLSAFPQQSKNLAELLGYPKDSKLLIIHADDMGLSHSVNTACIRAYEKSGITCGSIMEPCPWALEMTEYLKTHPEADAGIHLTLTAEWDLYKWGGVSPSDQITSLLDTAGFFYPDVAQVGKFANADEAGKELRGQIDRAIAMGINLTHIDTHMGSVLAKPELIKIYLGLSETYNLPVLFPRAYLDYLPAGLKENYGSKIFLLDNLFMLEPGMINGSWTDPYKKAIESMKPGLNEMIVHLGLDDDEMQAICKGHEEYGSLWRQKDLDLVSGNEFKEMLKENNIILIGWRQISDIMRQGR
jgi:predicted glycoside hydrolase/deacetylase ChbG (UPF0249 family)